MPASHQRRIGLVFLVAVCFIGLVVVVHYLCIWYSIDTKKERLAEAERIATEATNATRAMSATGETNTRRGMAPADLLAASEELAGYIARTATREAANVGDHPDPLLDRSAMELQSRSDGNRSSSSIPTPLTSITSGESMGGAGEGGAQQSSESLETSKRGESSQSSPSHQSKNNENKNKNIKDDYKASDCF